MRYVADGEWVAECGGVRNTRSRIAGVANSVNPIVIRFHGPIRHRPIEAQIASQCVRHPVPDSGIEQSHKRTFTGEGQIEKAKHIEMSERELKDKTGVYLDAALRRFWTLEVEDGRLVATARRGPNLVLAPALKDEFLSGGFNFDFTRDPQNKVNGFLMDTDRSINVRFAKRK